MASGFASVAFAQAAPASTPVQAAAPSPEALEIQRLIKSGQSTQALKLIDDSLAKNPKDPAMRFRRGVTLSMLDRKAEALQVFQKLVEDHPEMPAPYNNLAVPYGSQGDYDKARAALVAAIRTNPQYATAYQNLGDVYAQLASQAYSKALQLDKSDTTVPPKLVLLRELIANPNQAAAA
ncbi:MAG: tetratricopeptide repeat protein, partial [Caulobacter sp.]|nr:tetratricopeptide repeat protein [Vitreoscilla sp.]